MKFNLTWSFNLLLTLMGFQTHSQTSSCGDFTIVNIAADSINQNTLQISINYNGPSNAIVNYPYISALLDCNGDTVATGNMFWFGQLGQSTIEYPVLSNNGTPCQPLTAIFIYGDINMVNDTCLLSFNGSTGITENPDSKIHVFPNPTADFIHILFPNQALGAFAELSDVFGRIRWRRKIDETHTTLDLGELPQGTYYLSIDSHSMVQEKEFQHVKICVR